MAAVDAATFASSPAQVTRYGESATAIVPCATAPSTRLDKVMPICDTAT